MHVRIFERYRKRNWCTLVGNNRGNNFGRARGTAQGRGLYNALYCVRIHRQVGYLRPHSYCKCRQWYYVMLS